VEDDARAMILPLTLRPATPADDAFLLDLYAQNRQAELRAWGLDESMLASLLQMQFTAQQTTYATQYPDADHDLLLLDDEPVGRLYIHRAEDHLLLVDIALLPEVQGQGLGTALLCTLLEEAAEKGVPVRLQVVMTNLARHLYQRLGFTALGSDGVYEQMEWHPPGIAG